jgi:hypothetical protein
LLAVLGDQGIIVGTLQQLSINSSLEISQFGIDIETHLFMQQVAKHFLLHKYYFCLPRLSSEVYHFMGYYQELDYFTHALEILLHEVLEENNNNGRFNDYTEMLKNTIDLVKKFPQALEVIVNCARKSEMSIWGDFFKVCGDPKILYQVYSTIDFSNV